MGDESLGWTRKFPFLKVRSIARYCLEKHGHSGNVSSWAEMAAVLTPEMGLATLEWPVDIDTRRDRLCHCV